MIIPRRRKRSSVPQTLLDSQPFNLSITSLVSISINNSYGLSGGGGDVDRHG
jgi:hypothetical protein